MGNHGLMGDGTHYPALVAVSPQLTSPLKVTPGNPNAVTGAGGGGPGGPTPPSPPGPPGPVLMSQIYPIHESPPIQLPMIFTYLGYWVAPVGWGRGEWISPTF